MSVEENVALVQKQYDAFSRGDIPSLLATLDENIEWINPGAVPPLSGLRRGRDQVADFFRQVNDIWEFLSFEPREFIASGDRVIVLGHYEMRDRPTGRPTGSNWVMAWTVQNGKATRFEEYTDTQTLAASLATADSASA